MPSAEGNRENFHYSSFYFGKSGETSHSSTMFFNDGQGRLTMFEMETRAGLMTVTIRQNMHILWKGTYSVTNSHFFVKRLDSLGKVTFQIIAGEHVLRGEIDDNDNWVITETATEDMPSEKQDEMIPLSRAVS